MNFMTPLPWVQLLFSERTIMNVRKLFRDDGAETFSQVEGGLNMMSAAKFRTIVRRSEFTTQYFKIQPVKGIPLITSVPIVGELFSSTISAILKKS